MNYKCISVCRKIFNIYIFLIIYKYEYKLQLGMLMFILVDNPVKCEFA